MFSLSCLGVLSFSVQVYFPGSSYTSDLMDGTQPRFLNLKSIIEKAVSFGEEFTLRPNTYQIDALNV